MKNALPALGSGERQTGAKAKDTSKRLGEEMGSAGVRRGGKDTLVRLGGEATPRARAADARAAGGVAGRGDVRWAHASPRAGEAHALGARGGRAHPGGGVRNRARRTRGL